MMRLLKALWAVFLLVVVTAVTVSSYEQQPAWLDPVGGTLSKQHMCKPSQVHLALTGRQGEMRVMWKTHSRSCPTTVHYSESSVYGRSRSSTQLMRSQGTVRTYSGADMCASPARDYVYDTNVLHDVILSDLLPRRWYSYKIAHGRRIMRFQAPPPPGRKEGFQFLAYGDMGDPHHRQAKAPGARLTVRQIRQDVRAGADMVVHVGDLSYANGRENVWDSFMDAIEPAASRVPYMVAVGNHEYDYRAGRGKVRDPSGAEQYHPDWGNFGNDSGGECGVSVVNRFSMPGSDDLLEVNDTQSDSIHSKSKAAASKLFSALQLLDMRSTPNDRQSGKDQSSKPSFPAADGRQSRSSVSQSAGQTAISETAHAAALQRGRKLPNPPFWYSYDFGAVHFVALSSEHDLHHSSRQARWLRQDLSRVDRCVTPWVVVLMHRPMYVVYPHKSNRVVAAHLRQQLEEPLNAFEVDMVISGHVHSYARTCNVLDSHCLPLTDGGTTHITLGCGGHKLTDVNYDQPAWLEATQLHYGYGRFTVHDGYDLTFEYVRSSDGKVNDSKTFHNDRADRRECFSDPHIITNDPNEPDSNMTLTTVA